MKKNGITKDAFASLAIRSISEYFGFRTELTLVGNSQILVDVLGTNKPFEIVLINGHGDKGEFHLPELGNEIKEQYPFGSRLSSSQLGSFLKIKAHCVISTACSSGSDDMAKAFMASGARHFIAPTGYPDGSDALKMICDFLYFYGVKEKAPVEALSLAKIESNDSCMFKLWECNN